jgi:hypothetical protein
MSFADDIREKFNLPVELEELLRAAEQAHARWRQITEKLDEEGLVIPGRYEGVSRVNPLVAAEARARESFVRTLRALHLPEEVT